MSPLEKTLLALLAALFATGCPVTPPPAPRIAAPPAAPTAASSAAVEAGEADSAQHSAGALGDSSARADEAPAAAADPGAPGTDAAKADFRPLDLTRYYGLKAEQFDAIRQYPWPAVPRGSQTFAGVPLEIGGTLVLFGEENAKRGMKLPEEIRGIAAGRRFETLYICHATFFEAPAETPICEVRFQYDDETTESDQILYGSDVRDWFVNATDKTIGPSGKRSTLAWTGEGLANGRPTKIRFFLTAIANPRPEKTVQTIDLVSSKSRAASCILAMTTGKTGMMQPALPAEETEEQAGVPR